MLRPATPLTVLFFVAFVLLLLATISTPIVKAIPLAEVRGVKFGVFGYCTTTKCTPVEVGYSVGMKKPFPDRIPQPNATSSRHALTDKWLSF